MPAHYANLEGKHRVVDPRGQVLTNAQGHPVDGGGHATREDAVRQVEAINIHMHKGKSHDANNPDDRPTHDGRRFLNTDPMMGSSYGDASPLDHASGD